MVCPSHSPQDKYVWVKGKLDLHPICATRPALHQTARYGAWFWVWETSCASANRWRIGPRVAPQRGLTRRTRVNCCDRCLPHVGPLPRFGGSTSRMPGAAGPAIWPRRLLAKLGVLANLHLRASGFSGFFSGGYGAGEGNRTLVFSLGSCGSTIELHPHGPAVKTGGLPRQVGFGHKGGHLPPFWPKPT